MALGGGALGKEMNEQEKGQIYSGLMEKELRVYAFNKSIPTSSPL